MPVKLEQGWYAQLHEEFEKEYFKNLKAFLLEEKRNGVEVYPLGSEIFYAFDTTPFDQVKVVILGQDPYHGHGQAHGLCFSVKDGVPLPPSLVNIYKELNIDLGIKREKNGNLEDWAKQGVLLLNATLTVRANQAGSHQNKGWEIFTDTAIRKLAEQRENIVFILWGRYAQNKQILIPSNKHYVLRAAHPSPLSAYNGFFGCKHFSKTNLFLESKGIEPIKW